MPGLDLLAKDYADARICVFGFDDGVNVGVDGVEHFCGEGTNVVEICWMISGGFGIG